MGSASKREPLREPQAVLVLCADPDLSVRIVHWIGEAYHSPMRALDGYSASQMLDEGGVQALVTDRLLPPWPGLDPLDLLRKSGRDLAIIYVGDGDADNGTLARAAGATHVLPCPLRRQSVLDALSRQGAAA